MESIFGSFHFIPYHQVDDDADEADAYQREAEGEEAPYQLHATASENARIVSIPLTCVNTKRHSCPRRWWELGL